jgi:prepilin-type processing-associated H-X9-DG protein
MKNPEDAALSRAMETLRRDRAHATTLPVDAARAKKIANARSNEVLEDRGNVLFVDGGSGMNKQSANSLIDAVTPALKKLPSYNRIKGLKT